MTIEGFTPEQRAAVTDYLRDVDGYHITDFIYHAAVELCLDFRSNPLAEMEKILREIDSDAYLLAIPVVKALIPDDQEIIMPYSGDQEYPFLLLVVIGLKDAQKWMTDLQINPEQNMANLENTGLMFVKRGTEAARRGNYFQN